MTERTYDEITTSRIRLDNFLSSGSSEGRESVIADALEDGAMWTVLAHHGIYPEHECEKWVEFSRTQCFECGTSDAYCGICGTDLTRHDERRHD